MYIFFPDIYGSKKYIYKSTEKKNIDQRKNIVTVAVVSAVVMKVGRLRRWQ
jgi:hypothetical protein